MRGICLYLLMLLSAIGSCTKETKPQGILSKAQMADWMLDIYLAESRVLQLSITRDSAYKIFLPYQDSLMRRKSVQDSVLKKSYEYYLSHPIEFETVYDIVIDSLSLREQRSLQMPPVVK
jgi:Domain of unknown function (DUF4296)